MSSEINFDAIIIGGGIAGLWTLQNLRKKNYNAILLEVNALGAGQTVNSQGIIHGGLKYALSGQSTSASEAIANMPAHWNQCLQGKGHNDLSKAKILSDAQYLFSTQSLTSKIASFFASKALKSRVDRLDTAAYPEIFKTPEFKGAVYQLNESVLDIPSVIRELATPYLPYIYKTDIAHQKIIFKDDAISHIEIEHNDTLYKLKAKRFIFTAGKGNEFILKQLGKSAPEMQIRPLHMVVTRNKDNKKLYGHLTETQMNPRITVTTHYDEQEGSIWYIGGQLAEDGVNRSEAEQVEFSKKEISSIFPWLDFSNNDWASFRINRAEPKNENGKRPNTVFSECIQNAIIAWPIKLAFAPRLAEHIVQQMQDAGVTPDASETTILTGFEPPPFATPIWKTLLS